MAHEVEHAEYQDERNRLLFEATYVPASEIAPMPTRGMTIGEAPDEVPLIDYIGNLPTFQIHPTFRTHKALLQADPLVDGASNEFTATRFQDGNYTRVFVRKTTPNGQIVGEWAGIGPFGWKLDGFGLSASGTDLIVEGCAHDLPPDPVGRESADGVGSIPGVFVPLPGGAIPKAGPAGAHVPQAPQEPNVDYTQIQNIVRAEVNRAIASILGEFGPDGVEGALRSLPLEGWAWGIDPANYGDETAKQLQDGLFGFVKNANAGVQANILGGQDEWGQARRDELKQIIREVLAETSMLAELDTTEEEPS